MASALMLIGAFCLISLSIIIVIYGLLGSSAGALPANRRRPQEADHPPGLSRFTVAIVDALSTILVRRGWSQSLASMLERAGVRTAPAEFLALVSGATLIALLLGFLVGGIGLGLAFGFTGPFGAAIFLSVRESRRRHAFANQLDETLQLLAGGLRAGHSLLRAIDAVSHEAESPTDEEFARIVNETRLGRDLNDALEQSAARMQSQDFSWVAQAIGIHREVGGDLAGVLNEIGHTIRERNQIRRQVASLSAEGRMSAYILLALPFVVVAILILTSPTYILKFVQSPLGFVMMGVAAVMLTVGAIWMRKVVAFKF